jgi:zinc transport system ATP-binding protein
MNNAQTLIEARDVTYFYGKRQILSKISLTIHPSEIVTIIGPNGGGKTTLVRLLLGQLAPLAGEIIRHPHLTIGYMPQRIAINPIMPLRVLDLIRLCNEKKQKAMDKTRIETLAKEVGIAHLLQQQVHEISGGELQRALLARALLASPQLLILDEPASGVDIAGQLEFYRLIERIKREHGVSVLMVSHDLHFVMRATERVICLNHHICCAGTAEDVGQHPEYLQLFGKEASRTLAIYPHSHDHHHDLHGDVVHDCKEHH